MKLASGIVIAALLLGCIGASHATVRIADDTGGRIGDYLDKYRKLRDAGEFVVIDGLCTGACTLVLEAFPRDRICLTSNARLGFKAAWDRGADGREVINREATKMLYGIFPIEIRRWITQQGGLTAQMIYLEGKELERLFPSCAYGA